MNEIVRHALYGLLLVLMQSANLTAVSLLVMMS